MIDMGPSYQRKVLALLVRSPKHAYRVASMIRPEWMDDPILAEAVAAAKEYVLRYGTIPSKLAMKEEAGDDVVASPVYRKAVRSSLADAAYVADKLAEYCRYQACKRAVIASAEDLAKNRVSDRLVERLAEALRVGESRPTEGERLSEVDKRAASYLSPESTIGLIPTGWSHVDSVLEGGLGRGELGVILGATNRGKSQLLANIAANLYSQAYGYKVVYVSLEMRMKRLLSRLDRRIYGPKHEQDRRASPKNFVERLAVRHKMIRHPQGEVLVNFWPDGTLSLEELGDYLKQLREEHHYDFDVLIVDYAELLRRPKHVEMREHLASMVAGLRALGDLHNAAVWTVAQTNRAALAKKVVNLDDVGESYVLTQKADVVIAMCVTDAEKAENRGRLFFAKMREGVAYKTVPFTADFSRAYIKTEAVMLPETIVEKPTSKDERKVDEAMSRVMAQRKQR